MNLSTGIGKIKLEGKKLSWHAVGTLVDGGFDKTFDWVYYYTVVAWNDATLQAFVDQGTRPLQVSFPPIETDDFFVASNKDTFTALSCFPTFLYDQGF